jgi:uncharacterized cupredoxin-like copper-binding protein
MRKLTHLAALVAAAALLTAGCAKNADENQVSLKGGGTVAVRMTDNAYSPDRLEVAAGDTVTFKFTNDGKMTHEAFIGSSKEQDAHDTEMSGSSSGSSQSGMDMGSGSMDMGAGSMDPGARPTSDDAHMVTVQPGETAELTYTFDRPGTLYIGCHQPGHWASGMKATISVA